MEIVLKFIALSIMLLALYFLYRIAFPKQPKTKKSDDRPSTKEIDVSGVVLKCKYVCPDFGQPQTTHTTTQKDDVLEKNHYTFAPENSATIPNEKLDEVFDPEDLEIEEEETENTDLDDETENLGEREAEIASGLSIEQMVDATSAVKNPTDEKAEILFKVEKTDMFEQLVSGDEGKAAMIKAIIDRHVQSQTPEVEIEDNHTKNGNDWQSFDIKEFLG